MADTKDGMNNSSNNNKPDSDYWRSMEELYRDPTVVEASHHEFKEGATDDFEPSKLSGISRRKFLALVGASAALAGAGCSDYRDKGDIIPYTKKPEEITLGKADYYASTCTECGHACGILIKTREGRPIKIDGNPDHPVSKGKVCAKGQASILGLYDPERLKAPLKNNGSGSFTKTTWKQADTDIINALKNSSKEIAIVSNRIVSPTAKRVIDDFTAKYSDTKVYSYEVFNDQIRNAAWKKSYGSEKYPLVKWNEPKYILALESDFLGIEGNKVENARMFAEARDLNHIKKFNRLYSVEGNMSVTGMNADYRIKLRPDAQFEFIMCLVNELNKKGLGAGRVNSSEYSLKEFAKKYSLIEKTLNYLVNDLSKHKGESFIYAGDALPENVHLAVNMLNDALNGGKFYRTDSSQFDVVPLSTFNDLENLVSAMKAGRVGVVIQYDANPVFNLPDDLGYKDALKKVPMVISLVGSENESSALAKYVLPIHHTLEAWGDSKTRTGFYSLQQPVISPIFETRQKEAILNNWTGGNPDAFNEKSFHDYLLTHWEKNIYPTLNSKLDFKQFWFGSLHDGVVITQEKADEIGSHNSSALSELNKAAEPAGFTLVIKESYSTGDGRFANNSWLQELPHPVTKVTWDNFASISDKTAKRLAIKSGDWIEIELNGKKKKFPAFVQPGCADGTVTIELGYGRTKVGVVGSKVGFDPTLFMKKSGGLTPWIYTSAKISAPGGSYNLVSAQEHHAFDEALTRDVAQKRHIIREGTVAEYEKNPDFLHEEGEEKHESLYDPHDYPGVKWGMSIDLNKCIGCGECVVACVAENNIPIVGKDQVEKGREMQWLRIDRYYSGTPEEPVVSNQPMLCQQCDHAPCENVCPVVATTHSPDGLNQMIYNRCVGTRYCSNNCPYKVRRFNFFNFRDHFRDQYQEAKLHDLVYNPEVTVRSRGVMEKCTFCVQRTMEARENAIREGRPVKGSDVTTACQDACNTNAINFGDENDKDSEFYKYRNHKLGYYVLEDLNVRPNVTYLAKLRNTHTEEV